MGKGRKKKVDKVDKGGQGKEEKGEKEEKEGSAAVHCSVKATLRLGSKGADNIDLAKM